MEKGCFQGTILNLIRFKDNQLSYFPDFCSVNATLKTLTLGNNQISSVSEKDISCLKILETLGLNGNPMLFLPDVSQLFPSLVTLSVRRIQFTCCAAIAWMKDIDIVNIDDAPCNWPPSLNGTDWSTISNGTLRGLSCGEYWILAQGLYITCYNISTSSDTSVTLTNKTRYPLFHLWINEVTGTKN